MIILNKKYYITIKNFEEYYRYLTVEVGSDDSLYVWNGRAKKSSKLSFHSNRGDMSGPFQVHHKSREGQLIPESERLSGKFISDYNKQFAEYGFCNIDKSRIIQEVTNKDLLFNIGDDNIGHYKIILSPKLNVDFSPDKYDYHSSRELIFPSYNIIISLYKLKNPHF